MLLLAALAHGDTLVRHLLDSDDTGHMLTALAKLGVSCAPMESQDYRVAGVGGTFPVKSAELFIGNAGTAVRPLTAVLAFSGGRYRLSGVPRMHERPIRDLVDALRGLGADIAYLGKDGFPPLEIRPGALRSPVAARVRGDVSSQYVTALLMALPLVGGGTIAIDGDLVSKPYVEMTLNLMARFGVPATRTGWSSFAVPAASYRSPDEIHVEGDASSASYFLAAGAISGTRTGGGFAWRGSAAPASRATCGSRRCSSAWAPPCASARAGSTSAPGRIDIDRARRGPESHSRCRHDGRDARALRRWHERAANIGNWRVKETDRLAAMATELRKLGATVEEGTDHLRVTPPTTFRAATIDTYDDHRMAMCFSLAALGGVSVRINDPACVRKTFPEYFSEFLRMAVGER